MKRTPSQCFFIIVYFLFGALTQFLLPLYFSVLFISPFPPLFSFFFFPTVLSVKLEKQSSLNYSFYDLNQLRAKSDGSAREAKATSSSLIDSPSPSPSPSSPSSSSFSSSSYAKQG